MRTIAIIVAAFALGGCASSTVGSVSGGECRIARTPEYAVLGRTAYDQRWVNRTTEALVDGCRQPRPKARPKSFDAPAKARPVAKAKPAPAKRWFGI